MPVLAPRFRGLYEAIFAALDHLPYDRRPGLVPGPPDGLPTVVATGRQGWAEAIDPAELLETLVTRDLAPPAWLYHSAPRYQPPLTHAWAIATVRRLWTDYDTSTPDYCRVSLELDDVTLSESDQGLYRLDAELNVYRRSAVRLSSISLASPLTHPSIDFYCYPEQAKRLREATEASAGRVAIPQPNFVWPAPRAVPPTRTLIAHAGDADGVQAVEHLAREILLACGCDPAAYPVRWHDAVPAPAIWSTVVSRSTTYKVVDATEAGLTSEAEWLESIHEGPLDALDLVSAQILSNFTAGETADMARPTRFDRNGIAMRDLPPKAFQAVFDLHNLGYVVARSLARPGLSLYSVLPTPLQFSVELVTDAPLTGPQTTP